MPRFHFNVTDGSSHPDRAGIDLPDWAAARVEAIRRAGAILANDSERLALGEDWCMEVTDEAGLILFRLDFLVLETAATMARGSPLSDSA